jgi:hypothetical protein
MKEHARIGSTKSPKSEKAGSVMVGDIMFIETNKKQKKL